MIKDVFEFCILYLFIMFKAVLLYFYDYRLIFLIIKAEFQFRLKDEFQFIIKNCMIILVSKYYQKLHYLFTHNKISVLFDNF